MKSRRIGLLLLAVGCFCCWQSAGAIQSAVASSEQATLQSLPLWRALPSSAFVRLGGGTRAHSRWEAFVFRAPTTKDPDRVCVQIISAFLHEPFGVVSVSVGTPECGVLGSTIKKPILVQAASQEAPRSVLVVVTGVDTSEARVVVNPGKDLRTRFQPVGKSRSAKAKVSPFRYALLTSRRQVCVEQVLGEHDQIVDFETPAESCSVLGP
jgi:hypothetical protein